MARNRKPGDALLGFGAALVIIAVIFFVSFGVSPVPWAALIAGLVLLLVAAIRRAATSEGNG